MEIDTGLQKLDQDLQQNWDCSGPSKEAAFRETTKSQITVNVGENKKTDLKGSVKRKSYTLDFKLKTLGLLDKLAEAGVKNKWGKVAAMKGISNRSLVIKWNKDRSKIMNEPKVNKAKKGEGNFTAARQRRQITSTVKRRELYPLAVKAVLSAFHKRREKRAKVSKLWFCQKMKSKVKEIYGAAKASSFRCSNNWFQRFKKRHHIAWRNRTNKKKDSKEDSWASIQLFHQSLRRAPRVDRYVHFSGPIFVYEIHYK